MSPAEALGQALLHALWQGAVLALAAAVALGTLARASASLRHSVGMVFLGLMALAPTLTFFLLWGGGSGSGEGALPGTAAAAPFLWPRSAHPFSGFSAGWLPWAWAAGLALMLARLAGGWWVVRDLLRQEHQALPPNWLHRVEELAARMELRRPFEVRLTEILGLPCSARAWRPVIWIPVSLMSNLPPAHLEAVLLHEMAHVRRLDWIWNGLQSFIESLLFFHPGVWWLSRRVRIEREHACDDLAVALCGDAIALAEALATLEGLHSQPRMLALAANGGSLMNRITRLLSPEPPPRFPVRAALLSLICAGGVFAASRLDARSSAQAPPPRAEAHPKADESQTITIVEDNGQRREYKTWTDRNGQTQEAYSENGVSKPVDAKVRQWLADERKREAEEQRRQAEEETRAEAEEARAELESRRAEMEGLKAREHHLRKMLQQEQQRLGVQAARLRQEMERARVESEKLAQEAEKLQDQAYQRRQEALERQLDDIEEAMEPEGEDEAAPPAPPQPPKPPVPPKPPKAPKAGPRTAPPAPPVPPAAPPAPPKS